MAAVALLAGVIASPGRAERALLPLNTPAPWKGGAAVQTPLELLATRVAAHIAGHPLSVECDTAAQFRAVGKGDDAGYVHSSWDGRSGIYLRTSQLIHLNPRTCTSLRTFAQAASKPTVCRGTDNRLVPCFSNLPVNPKTAHGPYLCAPRPRCYLIGTVGSSYWHQYFRAARALWVLAHEAIHAGQAVQGRARVPDSKIEVQANCYGLQWLPYVATSFGADIADAQAIASYVWLVQYPYEPRTPPRPYWSSSCHPGGPLDIRAAGSTFWP